MTDRTRPSIRVTGDAIVSARPDQAQIDVGVVTQAPNAKNAADENARKVDAVLAALRKVLGPEAEIKTVGYSLNPNYV
ncbi:MAG TPA: SIMPL domain-containing protein, partial [Blastocatellia bacterium]|nr:SIMPL domain-containing protein [Blastocatellia bacterium]